MARGPSRWLALAAIGVVALVSRLPAFQSGLSAGIANRTWTSIGPGNIGGRTRAIVIHPTLTSTLFAAGVDGGIWKSTNGGASWNVVDDFMANLAVTCLLFQPNNPSIMFAGTGENFSTPDGIRGAGIFKSVDGGTTWRQLPSTANPNFFFVNDLAMAADGSVLIAATGSGVWRSNDSGASFTSQGRIFGNVIPNVQDVKFVPGSNIEAVIGGPSRDAYWSNDAGQSWQPSLGLSGGFGNVRVELATARSASFIVYAVALAGESSLPVAELWKSTDKGHSFLRVSGPVPALLDAHTTANAIWVDPTNDLRLLVGGTSVLQSIDGGLTFKPLLTTFPGLHSGHHVIVSDPGFNQSNNHRVYFGNNGGVYKIENITLEGTLTSIPTTPQVLTVLNNNYGVTQFYGGAAGPDGKIVGGTQDNGTLLFRPELGPQAWTPIAGGDGGFAQADPANPNFLYGEFPFLQIHRNSTGGLSPSVDISGCPNKPAPFILVDACVRAANAVAPFVLDPNNPNRLLAGGVNLWRTEDARALVTTTSGPAWRIIKPSTGSGPISAIAIDPRSSDRIWVGHNNGDLFVTSNGTSAIPVWDRIDAVPALGGPPDRVVTSIQFDPLKPNTVYVSFGGFNADNLWTSPDVGDTWSNISGTGAASLPAVPVRWFVPHPRVAGWFYAATDTGVFTSENFGQTWKVPHDGPANVAVFQLFFAGNTLVAVTHGRGMFTTVPVVPAPVPPTIVTQPAGRTALVGTSVALSVAVTGSAPYTYQWYEGASGDTTSPLAGATTSAFTSPPVASSTSYWVHVSNDTGGVDSIAAAVVAASPAVPGAEIIKNGGFSNGTAGWSLWEVPDIVSTVSNGVFQFFLANPQRTASRQAAVFQNTGVAVPANGPVTATFSLGNSSTVRKRITVLVLESDFSDLAMCTFWIPANQPSLRTYTMRTHTAKAWVDASIYFYAATAGSNGGNYLVDNVSLRFTPGQATDRTECVDPNAPAPFSAGVASSNLVKNGDFEDDTPAPWSLLQPITAQLSSGVLEFVRPTAATPAGVVIQPSGQAAIGNQFFTATFSLGNSSFVNKRVTVLLHDLDLGTDPDLMACTFILPPGLALSNYTMKGFATKSWANATISFYPATVGIEPWIRLDNVTFNKIAPTAGVIGTECIEPLTFPVASGGGPSSARPSAASSRTRVETTTTRTDGAPVRPTGDGLRLEGDKSVTDISVSWQVEATTTGRQILRLGDAIDLTRTSQASLTFASRLSAVSSSATVQVSTDGVTWETLSDIAPFGAWTTMDLDLAPYAGQTIYLQFVFDAVAAAPGAPPDTWRIDSVAIGRAKARPSN